MTLDQARFSGRQILAFHEIESYYHAMVTITFPDRETEKRALAFMLGRFSGRVLRSGEHLVPVAALEALADQNIPFSVPGREMQILNEG